MRTRLLALLAATALAASASPALAAKKMPYWASLNAGEVMMRKGPGRNFPADWLYKRKGLPVKVVKAYKAEHAEWRRIQDPDGAEGWVQANLLSDKRSALVVGDVRPLREKPSADAAIVWRAEPGVVGAVSQCGKGWCLFDVHGRAGYIEIAQLFGVAADEKLP
ncbi:SH3 domain-containing protein [Sphingomonas sp. SUN039]|uniref:SH3 domain-containing protein n=1 Tax=Sphingomonas sp. SUN039 TaxID=2937787 RepID=UPI002164E16E|nr:SH3 domain-containing protein [Sphingomonas sp. SUN039]UVO53945.1 SH3 domain-containing protein [Sphingomonas sp. SUN039]